MASVGKYSVDPSTANFSALLIVWSAVGACGLLGTGVQAATVRPLEGMRDKKNVLISVVAGLLNACGMFCLTQALAADPDSAGPITALLPLGAVLVCFMAWSLLGERLVLQQILGVLICVCGPICMALANGTKAEVSGMVRGLYAAVALGLFAFAKKTARNRGASPASVVLIICLVCGCCGSLGLLYCGFSGRGLAGLSATAELYAIASGVCWGLGTAFFQLALAGFVGPATAILNTNSVGVLVLTVLFFHVVPPPAKLVGMGLCVVGVIVLALAAAPPLEAVCGGEALLDGASAP